MTTVIDFSAGVPPAVEVKAAGHAGAIVYAAPGREQWMRGKQPDKAWVDSMRAAGLGVAFVWQFRNGGSIDSGDAGRGHAGGVDDAIKAAEYLKSVGCADHPVFFACDWDVTLTEWNSRVVEYFKGAMSVLGRKRMGIYGHSRVVAWAQEDNVVAEVEAGRVLGWVTKSWSGGEDGRDYAVAYQGTHNVPGPAGIAIDVNTVYASQWGQAPIEYRVDFNPAEEPVKHAGLHFDRRMLMGKNYSTGRVYNGVRHRIKFVARHHVAGRAGLAKAVDGEIGCWDIWQTREASAHAVAYEGADGRGLIGQAVRPEDTAWAMGDAVANRDAYTIEHQNCGGPDEDWPIKDSVIIAGARHAAEVLVQEKLGPPVFGVNIRDHREFYATSCPYHLANGGKYHARWMAVCREHYEFLTTKEEDPMIKSLINPAKSFAQSTLISIVDATCWQILVLAKAIAKKQGLDPDQILADAITADREGK